MSVYLYLYSKKPIARDAIERVIYALDFKPIGDSHGRWYWWFDEENYKSVCGCKLIISKPDPNDPSMPIGTQNVLYAVVHGLRSYEDVEMQNNVIRRLRSVFGGSVYNDGDGRHSYAKNYIPRLSPAEKRCGLIYGSFLINLGRALFALSDIQPEFNKRQQLLGEFASFDKGLITNNLVTVFLVSILETFLKDFFIAFVEMHPDLQEKIYEKQSKIDFQTLRALLGKEKTLAEVEAENYTFQNLGSANQAYLNYLKINLYDLWNKKRKFNNRFYKIREAVEELMQLRHKIVHTAYLNPNLDKAEVDKYRKIVESAGSLLAESLEKKDFRIDLDKYLF